LGFKRLNKATIAPITTSISPIGTVPINNHKYPPLPEPSSNMDVPLRRDVTKASAMGRNATNTPMRIRGTLFMKKSIDRLTLFTQQLGVLPPSAIAPGGTFTEESTYYFNGEVEKWNKTRA